MQIPAVLTFDPEWFPHPRLAMSDPNGLLAVGGDLSPHRLLSAYRQGIFPWSSDPNLLMWWSPDPRAIIDPNKIHISKSLRKKINRQEYTVSFDQAFAQVINACAKEREDDLTWITPDMINAYQNLFTQGYAHSVEVWQNDRLVGGLYGLAIGDNFSGESMFCRVTDASKIALVYLAWYLRKNDYRLIDCQIPSEHLISMGASLLKRADFLNTLPEKSVVHPTNWNIAWSELANVNVCDIEL